MSTDSINGSSAIWSLPVITIPPKVAFLNSTDSSSYAEYIEGNDTFTNTLNIQEAWNSTFIESISVLNCTNPLQHILWSDVRLLTSLIILLLINIIVLVGNVLVIIAIFSTAKLRTVTNLFIASLAVADLLLGVVVLPFSSTVEVFQTWLFGELWCSAWLAVDVWLSTASILNLCAISLDRYVAVTKPVKYPTKMTPSRAKLLICGVWIFSFVICFPPLVGWNDRHKNLSASDIACVLTCELTNDPGYVIYSAMGSFYLPMLVMMFFYWKIYLAAAETTRAINQGFRNTRNKTQKFNEEKVTLRIHVGRNNSLHGHSRSSSSKGRKYSSVKMSSPRRNKTTSKENCAQKLSLDSSCSIKSNIANDQKLKTKDCLELACLSPNSARSVSPRLRSRSSSTYSIDTGFSVESIPLTGAGKSSVCNNGTTTLSKRGGTYKMGKRNIKLQVKKFRMETKAAKTLGIIVGVFILCWFPFFTMYIVRAFCANCIHPLLFSVLFWLGYCNSAINPCIYALFSKDFRLAFKKILCKCLCRRQPRKWPLPMPSLYLPSLGNESDETFEEIKC